MTSYTETVGKRTDWGTRQSKNTGFAPLAALGPTATSAGSALAGTLGGAGILQGARSALTRRRGGGSSSNGSGNGNGPSGGGGGSGTGGGGAGAGAGAGGGGSNRVMDIAGAGLTGYTVGDVIGGEGPLPDGADIGNLAIGSILILGSGWAGIQSGFSLDSPLTPLSGGGIAVGGLMLYSTIASVPDEDEEQ